MASCQGQAFRFLQPRTAPAQAVWLASGAGLLCSLSQVLHNSLLTSNRVPRGLHRIHFRSYISSFSVLQSH